MTLKRLLFEPCKGSHNCNYQWNKRAVQCQRSKGSPCHYYQCNKKICFLTGLGQRFYFDESPPRGARGIAVNRRVWRCIYIIDIVNYMRYSLPSFRNFSKGGVAGLQFHLCVKRYFPAGVVRSWYYSLKI